MAKPSMFSKDYHKKMWRRKIIFRTFIVIFAFVIIYFSYNRMDILNVKKIFEGIKPPIKNDISPQVKVTPVPDMNNNQKGINDKEKQESNTIQKPVEQINDAEGEYNFKLSDDENMAIIYSKKDNNKFVGIKPSDKNIFFDISDDGKAIVFDNPKTSDIWICNIEGEFKKLSTDSFKEYGGSETVFNKSDVMTEFENNYIWAAKPKFLKDGRVIYQSYLPWFTSSNNCYLWVVDRDGQNNRYILAGAVDGSGLVKYVGFTQEGNLIFETSGNKYALNVDNKSKQRID